MNIRLGFHFIHPACAGRRSRQFREDVHGAAVVQLEVLRYWPASSHGIAHDPAPQVLIYSRS